MGRTGKFTGLKCLVRISLVEAGQKMLLAGQRDATLNITFSEIDVSSKDSSGGWEEKIAGNRGWELSCGGAQVANDESIKMLDELMLAPEHTSSSGIVLAELEMPHGDKYQGEALVTSFSRVNSHTDLATYDLSLSGTGPLSKVTDAAGVAGFSGATISPMAASEIIKPAKVGKVEESKS